MWGSNSANSEKRDIWLPLHLVLVAFVILWSALRLVLFDWSDRYQCEALLNEGQWLDGNHGTWQPNGCMLHSYSSKELSTCLQTEASSKRIVFVGDSVGRTSFYSLAKLVDPYFSTVSDKHSDRIVQGPDGITIEFYWDPFLNTSATTALLSPDRSTEAQSATAAASAPPALLVFSTGMWHMRYMPGEAGLQAYATTLDRIFDATLAGGEHIRRLGNTANAILADEVVVMPVQLIVESLLSPERAAGMSNQSIRRFNDLLRQKEATAVHGRYSGSPTVVEVPWSFNEMLGPDGVEPAETSVEGLHLPDAFARHQINILLNLRCNDVMPKKFPLDKTCCGSFPDTNFVQLALLAGGVLGPLLGVYLSKTGSPLSRYLPKAEVMSQIGIFGGALLFVFLGDRTSLFLRASKSYDGVQFAVLCLLALGAGLATLEKSEKGDLGFLNRQQTDEWKGWMQVAILIYHYLGASRVSPIYNPIRAMVAAYLFMSGYGHFFFYYKKGDYSFARVFSVLLRLNLLPVLLAYTMDTDWLSYYFSPLVTMWFGIIWLTMWLMHPYNKLFVFILAKILLSAFLVGLFFFLEVPLRFLFEISNNVFRTEWNAREWTFRVTLDLLIPYFGMLAALVYIKIAENRLTESPYWPQYAKVGTYIAAAGMIGYILFESQLDKFTYNIFHPYASIVPVIAFAILRNATPYLRSVNSKFFMYFGQCSLETFIIQFHLWMAADTKGLLVFIRGTSLFWRFLNFVVASLVYVFISEKVATATGAIVSWLSSTGTSKPGASGRGAPSGGAGAGSGSGSQAYTAVSTSEPSTGANIEAELDKMGILDPVAPPTRTQRLLTALTTSLKVKMLAILGLLWAMNLLYPTESPPDGHLVRLAWMARWAHKQS